MGLPARHRIAVVAGLVAALHGGTAAAVLVEGNIETSVRPFVWIQYPDQAGNAAERTAAAIFDTGDPWETLSRETASVLGIAPATPLNPSATPPADANFANRFQNQGTTAAQTVVSGGWLGAILDPAERDSVATAADSQVRADDNAHLFDNAEVFRVDATTSRELRLWYGDYRRFYSENHTGMPFVTRAAPGDNLAVLVDPVNGTPLPFAYDNANAGNGRNLEDPSLPLDMRASSVTYLANDDRRVSVPGRNDNPGFVHFLELLPIEFSTSVTPRAASSAVGAGLPANVESRLTVTVSNTDGPNVTRLVPDQRSGQNNGIEVFYRPADDTGSVFAFSATHEVRENAQRRGGQENTDGFVRTDGELQVVVRQADGTVVRTQTVAQPSQAPRPFVRVGGVNYLVDTGAPNTEVPSAVFAGGTPTTNPDVMLLRTLSIPTLGGGTLTLRDVPVRDAGTGTPVIGTDVTNRFGQVWDFSPGGRPGHANRGTLALVGPTDARIRGLRGEGVLFGVDAATLGLRATAVEQEQLFGRLPRLQGNPLANPPTGADTLEHPLNPLEAAGSVFRTHLTGSNATYISEEALGLRRGVDVIDAQSLGADDVDRVLQLFFGVDGDSRGQAVSDTARQARLRQQAADIYEVPLGQPNPARAVLANTLTLNQEVMGLGDNVGPNARALAHDDNLLGFDLYTQRALPARSLSNLDPHITRAGDTGTMDRPRVGADRLAGNFDLYFSLLNDQNLYRSNLGDMFADGFLHIGLSQLGLDDIDALALYRPSVARGRRGADMLVPGPHLSEDLVLNRANGGLSFDQNTLGLLRGIDMFQGRGVSDLALFSLSPDSPSLGALGLSAADVFITDFDGSFSLFASAESLGLMFTDNIDGLDSRAARVDEPAALLLAAAGGVLLAACRRPRSPPPRRP